MILLTNALLAGSFIAPAFLGFLSIVPIVIVLYLLKLKRTEIVIPSTILWEKSLYDLTANSPFQRLVVNLLLILQLIIVGLLVLALIRPFFVAPGTQGKNLCLLIDRSASMQAREGAKTRLELAQDAALAMVDQLERGEKMMVIAFADKTEVRVELTDDRARLRDAIRGVTPTDGLTNIRDVMTIARSLAPDNPDQPSIVRDLELILLGDGKITDLERLGAAAIPMKYLKIGSTKNNAGIVHFSAREKLDQKDQRQAFVMVHNESAAPLEATLTLYLEDETLAVEEVKAEPGRIAEVLFDLTGLAAGMLRVELDHPDALPNDNAAWLLLAPPTRLKVLVVANPGAVGAYFLKRALALDPRVDLAAIAPDSYIDSAKQDLTFFDNWAPPVLPEGAMIFINAVPPLEGLSQTGTIDDPPILAKDPDHPAMRFLSIGNLRVGKALKLTLPDGARPLISTRSGALVVDLSRAGRQLLLIAFDLADSNWPLNLSFPLFIQNALAWAPRAEMTQEESSPTGRALAILPDPAGAATTAKVTLPDGAVREIALDPLRPVFFAETSQAGVYRVERDQDRFRHAVNLLDLNESSIAPAAKLEVGRGEIEGQTGAIKQNRELWRWLVAAALIVLAAEWTIYCRRAWI